ncbi:Hypothetical predicted protein [Podarcis lilfordi]|uniref:Uncharacterized protein n=1 Tax=Podarcis lilfordi TaxID=74358 RepID=A0AA35JYN4_9SAUR|nr:Hypothetical predicted protein [Podarcis lilfordi]
MFSFPKRKSFSPFLPSFLKRAIRRRDLSECGVLGEREGETFPGSRQHHALPLHGGHIGFLALMGFERERRGKRKPAFGSQSTCTFQLLPSHSSSLFSASRLPFYKRIQQSKPKSDPWRSPQISPYLAPQPLLFALLRAASASSSRPPTPLAAAFSLVFFPSPSLLFPNLLPQIPPPPLFAALPPARSLSSSSSSLSHSFCVCAPLFTQQVDLFLRGENNEPNSKVAARHSEQSREELSPARACVCYWGEGKGDVGGTGGGGGLPSLACLCCFCFCYWLVPDSSGGLYCYLLCGLCCTLCLLHGAGWLAWRGSEGSEWSEGRDRQAGRQTHSPARSGGSPLAGTARPFPAEPKVLPAGEHRSNSSLWLRSWVLMVAITQSQSFFCRMLHERKCIITTTKTANSS